MQSFTHIHCIGIGGIHVSAVARLLKARGVRVSGSDAIESDETTRLRTEGIDVTVGHDSANVPADTQAVVYSDAVPESNPERVEAAHRNLPSLDSHRFLGQLFADATQIVVTGTHGKSTTTAMVGKLLEAAGEDPTVVVGTRVPGWGAGNLRIGRTDLIVVEGDEFKSHVLSYRPTVLALTNIEWDHPDIFKTEAAYIDLFREAIERVSPPNGAVVYHAEDAQSAALVAQDADRITAIPVAANNLPPLHLPGEHNRKNAALARAAVCAYQKDVDLGVVNDALAAFPGVWRRFERVGELHGAPVISDYGHHPTEIRETLAAAKEAYPDHRIVLCYQPHQHARTKRLFNDFIPVLAQADALILAPIYDVPGREEAEYADISSQALLDALPPSSAPRRAASSLEDAEQQLRDIAQPNDLILVMGAGTIDTVARHLAT